MSWWIYGRDRDGKASVWQVDVEPMLTVMVLGLSLAVLVPSMLRHPSLHATGAFGLMVAGVGCILVAKIPLWRRGVWTSWGSRRMTRGYAILYRSGWAGIGFGVLWVLLALLVHQQR
jgi:hypothetical protein